MSSTPWLICPQPNPQAQLSLLCCHPAGSGASIFRSWVNYMHPDIELCALQLPGRESRIREPLITQLPPLIETLTHVLSSHLASRPFAFFGHSLGALICFALARQLRSQQLPEPIHLFLSSRKPPDRRVNYCLHQQPDRILIEKLRNFAGTPEPVLQNPELMELFLRIFRADLTLNETYSCSPEPPFNYPITVFGGLEDNSVSEAQLSQWQIHTSHDFRLQMFPGSHMFFLKQPQGLASSISDSLVFNQTTGLLRR